MEIRVPYEASIQCTLCGSTGAFDVTTIFLCPPCFLLMEAAGKIVSCKVCEDLFYVEEYQRSSSLCPACREEMDESSVYEDWILEEWDDEEF